MKKHPNIISFKEVVVGFKEDSIFLIFEYCTIDMAKLSDNLHSEGLTYSEPEIKCLILQLIQSLLYLHHNWIFHRDVKPSNILINKNGILKLADFGSAREFNEK